MDRPPIVFVHGTRFARGQWQPQLAARPPEVVEVTIVDGYAFHTLLVVWRDVMGRFDASSIVAVGAPVLILYGERDRLFRSGEQEFARARPGIRVELVPGAVHLANFDAPAAVTDAIRRFARELSRPPHAGVPESMPLP